MGPSENCVKKIFKTQTLLKIMGCEKSMKLHQKRKKYEILVNRSNCVFSLFNRKLKSENVWDHHSSYWYKKNLMKEVKKRLNTKSERYLARSHALPHKVSTYIYIYIYIYILIDWLSPISPSLLQIGFHFKVSLIVHCAWVTFSFISSHL